MSAKKKAKAKRLPKPVPCEQWGVYDKDGKLHFNLPTKWGANFVARKSEGEFIHRVRITPVAKRRKGAK